MQYKLVNTSIGIQYITKIEENSVTTFGPDPANTDYQAFKKDLQAGVALEDATGTAMTAAQITTFLSTLS
jgi:hypothetical protein